MITAYARLVDNDETRIKSIENLRCMILSNSAPPIYRIYVERTQDKWKGPFFVHENCINLNAKEISHE